LLFTSWHGPCWRDAATAAAAAVRRTVAVLIQHPPWQREREAGTGVVRPAGWLADLRRTTPELDRLGNDKQSQLSSPDPRVLHAYRCRELYERLKVAASSNRRTITAEISADFPRCRSPIMRLLSNGHTVAIAVPAECKLIKIGQVFAPGAARRYAPAAHGSSTCGGSTSARGRVRSPHISGGRPAAGSQRAYSIGWDRQTDGQIAVSLNAPPPTAGV